MVGSAEAVALGDGSGRFEAIFGCVGEVCQVCRKDECLRRKREGLGEEWFKMNPMV